MLAQLCWVTMQAEGFSLEQGVRAWWSNPVDLSLKQGSPTPHLPMITSERPSR
jgi:hypothetical protein